MKEFIDNNGVVTKLYNPAEKGKHFSKVIKKDAVKKDGTPYAPFYKGKAAGYLEARKDASKIFKKKNPGYVRKTPYVTPK